VEGDSETWLHRRSFSAFFSLLWKTSKHKLLRKRRLFFGDFGRPYPTINGRKRYNNQLLSTLFIKAFVVRID